MTEPIKLPPDALAVELVRRGIDKHDARVIEAGVNLHIILAVEQATADLRAELSVIRATLAGGDADSLPNDYTTIRMAATIRSDRDKFMWQVRDTCARAEKTEAERDEALAHAESAEAGQSDAGFVGLKVMQERDEARAELARLTELLSDVCAVEAELAEKSDELARLTTLRPYEEHAEGAKLYWVKDGSEWVCDPLLKRPSHWTPLPDVKEAKP